MNREGSRPADQGHPAGATVLERFRKLEDREAPAEDHPLGCSEVIEFIEAEDRLLETAGTPDWGRQCADFLTYLERWYDDDTGSFQTQIWTRRPGGPRILRLGEEYLDSLEAG